MLLFPEVQSKIQRELDDVVGRGNTPNMASVQTAKYLKAVWQESLRLLPPIPTSMSSCLLVIAQFTSCHLGVPHFSSDEDHWKGRYIPKGTLILSNIMCVRIRMQYFLELTLWIAGC